MQSVEKNDHVRNTSPLFLTTVILATGALLMTQGCATRTAETPKVEQPSQVVMPPTPQPTPEAVVAPPPAAPDFKTMPPPPAPAPESIGGITYTVKNGDSISKIAAKYGVSSREICELNNISNPNKIKAGQKIVLPAYAKEVPVSHKKAAATKSTKTTIKKSAAAQKPVAAAEGEYVVKSGDSLSKIAAKLHTSVKALREANGLQNDNLKIGQKLKVGGKAADAAKPAATATETAPAVPETPAPAVTPAVDATPATAPAATPAATPAAVPAATPGAAMPATAPQTFEITVDAGETLETIAAKYGVLPADIKALNNVTEVAPGQKIKLPLPTP